jgi:hypothetical protein
MRTNDFLKSFPPDEHSWEGKVTIGFSYPKHGWIQMPVTCSAYVQGLIVKLSAVFDPFPEMIRWLEDIAAAKLPTEFIIDEEGLEKIFRASPIDQEVFLFQIANLEYEGHKSEEEPLFMYVKVSKDQFLSEFLRRWDELIEEKYDPEHWKESNIDLRKLDVAKIRLAVGK